MKHKISKEIRKIKKAASENPTLTTVGLVGGTILLFIVIKSFISLLPVFGIAIVALIAYKLYKSGFFG